MSEIMNSPKGVKSGVPERVSISWINHMARRVSKYYNGTAKPYDKENTLNGVMVVYLT